jgi:hypothetical protein
LERLGVASKVSEQHVPGVRRITIPAVRVLAVTSQWSLGRKTTFILFHCCVATMARSLFQRSGGHSRVRKGILQLLACLLFVIGVILIIDHFNELSRPPSEFYTLDGVVYDLTAVNRRELYFQVMNKTRVPRSVKFATATPSTQLEIVLIELTPNPVNYIGNVLCNIANVYGGTDVALSFVFAHDNAHLMSAFRAFSHWNIRFIPVVAPPPEKRYDWYSQMLTSEWFWEYFESRYVLITQADVMIIRPIERFWYQFDYVGGPWYEPLFRQDHEQEFLGAGGNFSQPLVGNGGYSLRNVQMMKDIVKSESNDKNLLEDLFFSIMTYRHGNLPPYALSFNFSVEAYARDIEHNVPTGIHKLYIYDVFEKSGEVLRAYEELNF